MSGVLAGEHCEFRERIGDAPPCNARAFALIKRTRNGIEFVQWICGEHQAMLRRRHWRLRLVRKWTIGKPEEAIGGN